MSQARTHQFREKVPPSIDLLYISPSITSQELKKILPQENGVKQHVFGFSRKNVPSSHNMAKDSFMHSANIKAQQ